ncbi:MAG: DUF4148 domain-containing protein [Burkholderiales bacterium]|nr:DUF4148 domain-containing protein [Burkholderiales bacterium]
MKAIVQTAVLAVALSSAAAFAQAQPSNQPLTRAQVMSQLMQLRQSGYVPSKIHYPADIQAAEARAGMQPGVSTASNRGIGGAQAGASLSGSRMTTSADWRSMFGHH